MSEIKPIFTCNTNAVGCSGSDAKPQPTLLDVSIWARMNKNSDGIVTQQEAREYGFSAWEITEPISQSDFEAKIKAYNDKILAEPQKVTKGYSDKLESTKAVEFSNYRDEKEHFDNHSKDATWIMGSKVLQSDKVKQEKIEQGKNPGLNIKKLHDMGYTGKGVKVAILDGELTQHNEYSKNIKAVERFGNPIVTEHGSAVTSLFVGKNSGVAPDAELYYFAVDIGATNDKRDKQTLKYTNDALKRILEINKTAKKADDKIQVVSHSWGGVGWNDTYTPQQQKEYQEYLKLKEALEKTGVIFADNGELSGGADYNDAGRISGENIDAPKKIKPAYWWNETELASTHKENLPREFYSFLIQGDGRSVASPCDSNTFDYYGKGGMSWTSPQMAGIITLAKQIRPDINAKDLMKIMYETSSVCGDKNGEIIVHNEVPVKFADGEKELMGRLPNPLKLIERLKSYP